MESFLQQEIEWKEIQRERVALQSQLKLELVTFSLLYVPFEEGILQLPLQLCAGL